MNSIGQIKIECAARLADGRFEARLLRRAVLRRYQTFGRWSIHIGQLRIVRLLFLGDRAFLELGDADEILPLGQT